MGFFGYMGGLFSGKKSGSKSKPVGVPGFAVHGGYLQTSERDQRLVGTRMRKTFADNLLNVGIVGAGVRLFIDLASKTLPTMTPADDSTEAEEWAAWAWDVMTKMATPLPRIQRRTVTFRFEGFSIQTWHLKRLEDGLLAFADVAPRPQHTIERWDVDDYGTVIGVGQRSPQTGEEIYIGADRMVYAVDDALSDSPEGVGLFRQIAESCHRYRAYLELEGVGYETDLVGIPKIFAPLQRLMERVADEDDGMTEEQMVALLKPLKDFAENRIRNPKLALFLDSEPYVSESEAGTVSAQRQFDVEMMKGGGPHEPLAKAIERTTADIARSLGVEHLLLGSTPSGTRSLDESKSDTFALKVDAALQEVAWVYQRDLIDVLWRINGLDEAMKPTLTAGSVSRADIDLVTTSLERLARAGSPLMPDDPAIPTIYGWLELPPPNGDDRMAIDAAEGLDREISDAELAAATDTVVTELSDKEEAA